MAATWIVRAAPVAAEGGGPQLVLPLVAALAAARMAGTLPGQEGGGRWSPSREQIPFLPQQLQIPDVYAEREKDFIDVDRTRNQIDNDRYVWIDILPRRYRGWMASFAYDQEGKDPLPDSGLLVNFYLEYRF